MEIKKIRLSHLRNEAHYEFLVVFDSLLNKFPAVKALINNFYTPFTQLLDTEKHFVDAAQKSPLTDKLVEADNRIDRDITAFRNTVKASVNHFNTAIAEAAKSLYLRLKEFGYISKKPYEEESAAMQIFVSDLQTTFAQQVQTLGLAQWVAELADAETAFTNLYLQRNAEKAARPQGSMKHTRKNIEAVYRKIITTVQNNLDTTGEATCGRFALELNEALKYAGNHIRHRKKTDIAEATVAAIPGQPCTGRQVIVIPDVRIDGVPLVLATDFTVAYKNNILPGNAQLVIRGTGDFKGSKTVTFNIVKV